MALLLHIDTSDSRGLAMLAKDGKIICSKSSAGEREHAARINGMIADVLEEAEVGLVDVVPFLVEDELIKSGGLYSKSSDWAAYVVQDGSLITGQNPASSAEAAKQLLQLLTSR